MPYQAHGQHDPGEQHIQGVGGAEPAGRVKESGHPLNPQARAPGAA